MNLIKDLLPIFKKHILIFEKKESTYENIYTFYFKAKKTLKWTPGQHGIFIIKDKKINRPIRPFSLASSPCEKYIIISVKINKKRSEFKQELANMKKGDELIMRGPVGGFYLKNNKPSLFIAGGIGVTPYRSIMFNLANSNVAEKESINMLYIDSKNQFLYQEFFNNLLDSPKFNIHYLSKQNNFYDKLNTYLSNNKNQSQYFVTGPKSLVKSVEKILWASGIKRRNIKKDTFIGY